MREDQRCSGTTWKEGDWFKDSTDVLSNVHTKESNFVAFAQFITPKRQDLRKQMHWTTRFFAFFPQQLSSKHFSLQYIFSKVRHSSARNDLQFFMWKVFNVSYVVMQSEMPGQILVNLPNVKFYQNLRFPSPAARTDWHDEAVRHIIFASFRHERSEQSRRFICRSPCPSSWGSLTWHAYCDHVPQVVFAPSPRHVTAA